MDGRPDAAAEIRGQYPGWTLWVSGTGRWWASRTVELTAANVVGAGTRVQRGELVKHEPCVSYADLYRPPRSVWPPTSTRPPGNSTSAAS